MGYQMKSSDLNSKKFQTPVVSFLGGLLADSLLKDACYAKEMSRILDTDSTQKSDFLRSTLSILYELEWPDFDRNHLIAFQFTVMNTENPFCRGGRFLVLSAPVLFCLSPWLRMNRYCSQWSIVSNGDEDNTDRSDRMGCELCGIDRR